MREERLAATLLVSVKRATVYPVWAIHKIFRDRLQDASLIRQEQQKVRVVDRSLRTVIGIAAWVALDAAILGGVIWLLVAGP